MGEAARSGHPRPTAGRDGRRRLPGAGRRPRRAARLRRAGALLLAPLLALAAGPALAPAAQAAPLRAAAAPAAAHPAAAPAASAKTRKPPALSLDSVTPAVPQKGSTLSLSGTVSNPGGTTLQNLSVRLRIGAAPLGSRSAIASVADGHPPDGTDGTAVGKATAAVGTLAPGASSSFLITVPVNSLPELSGDGVYEIAVELVGGSGATATRAAITRSFLPWYPDTAGVRATRVATVWPITATPRVQAQTFTGAAQAQVPVLTDDGLAGEMAAGGRLDQLLSLGSQLDTARIPVTWVVDPDLLDTAADMSSGYRVATGDDTAGARDTTTKAGTGGTTAADWLAKAKADTSGQEVVSLPYADPDLASIAHNGGSSGTLATGLTNALAQTVTAGAFTTDSRLGTTAESTVAWPYQGYLDSSVLRTARAMHATTVLVNGASMPESSALTHTPDAARSIGDGTTAVVADSTIAGILSGDLSTAGAQTQAVQRLLAETLMITLEEPSVQRSILVMPPRSLSADGAQVLSEALQDAVQGKWAQGASLKSITAAGTADVNRTVPAPASYPAAARSGELSNAALGAVIGVDSTLNTLKEILTRTYRVTDPFGAARARSLSTAWRSAQNAGNAYRASTQTYADTLLQAVRLLPKSGSLTLTGTSGRIPITVQNDLQQDVQNLSVRLTSSNELQMNVSAAQPVTIPGGGRNVTLQFSAAAKTNAQVHVTADLVATSDGTVLSTITFTVNVTSVSGGVIWVVAGGVLLVVLAGMRMYGQRKKRAADTDPPEDAPVEGQDPRIESESRG